MTEPARSDTSGLTPLSITATVVPCPLVTDQADGALTASSTHICASRTVSAPAGAAAAAPAAPSKASMSRLGRRPPRPPGGVQHAGPPGQLAGGGDAPIRAPIQSDIPSATLSISSLS